MRGKRSHSQRPRAKDVPPARSSRRRRRRAATGRRWLLWAALLMLLTWALWPGSLARRMLQRHPDALVIHHSATPAVLNGRPVDAAAIDEMHARRGFRTIWKGKVYHIGYHYVVLPDGKIETGRPEGCVGAHARYVNDRSLGICLIGNFSSADNPWGTQGPERPTREQMQSLTHLSAQLVRKYDIALGNVRLHREVGQTACPGDRFPDTAFRRELKREVASPGRTGHSR